MSHLPPPYSEDGTDVQIPAPAAITPPDEIPTESIAALDEPPEYRTVTHPTVPVTYTFSPLGSDAMLLIPPPTAPDPRPKYRISVRINCFTPTSHITTIRRGDSEDGELVGDFEIGYTTNRKPPTLFIRGKELRINEIFKSSRGVHNWVHWDVKLSWVEGPDCAVVSPQYYLHWIQNSCQILLCGHTRRPSSWAEKTRATCRNLACSSKRPGVFR
jgi:hypothetical protein